MIDVDIYGSVNVSCDITYSRECALKVKIPLKARLHLRLRPISHSKSSIGVGAIGDLNGPNHGLFQPSAGGIVRLVLSRPHSCILFGLDVFRGF